MAVTEVHIVEAPYWLQLAHQVVEHLFGGSVRVRKRSKIDPIWKGCLASLDQAGIHIQNIKSCGTTDLESGAPRLVERNLSSPSGCSVHDLNEIGVQAKRIHLPERFPAQFVISDSTQK